MPNLERDKTGALMNSEYKNDQAWMRIALVEARKGLGATNPNPTVGAVIVKDGRLLARAYHRRAGRPHADDRPELATDPLLQLPLQTSDFDWWGPVLFLLHPGRSASSLRRFEIQNSLRLRIPCLPWRVWPSAFVTAPATGLGLVAPNTFRASAKANRIQCSSLWNSEFIGIEVSMVGVARLAFGGPPCL